MNNGELNRRRLLGQAFAAAGVGTGAMILAASPAAAATPGTVFDPRDFGAVGDGVANDTAAIQLALDAAHAIAGTAAGIVWITPGSYRLTTHLVVRDGTTIWAYGAYLFADGVHALLDNHGTSTFTGYTGHSNITVLGGIWDGRANSSMNSGQAANIFDFRWARAITIRDVVVRNVASYHAIELNTIDGAVVDGCRFEGFVDAMGDRGFSEAVQLDCDDAHTKNVTISNCYVGKSVDGSALGSFGTAFGNHSGRLGRYYENIRISNNTLEDCLDEGIRLWDARHAVISGNIVRRSGDASIFVRVSDPADDPLDPDDAVGDNFPYDVQISGNVIEDSKDQGIQLLGVGTALLQAISITDNIIRKTVTPGISIDGAGGCIVSGNMITDTGGTSIFSKGDGTVISNNVITRPGSNGVTVEQSVRCIVQGNRISQPAGYGVVLTKSANDCLVTGNLIFSAATAALRISVTSHNNFLTGNLVRGTGKAVWVESGCNNNTCTQNDFTGYGSNATTITGTIRKTIAADPNLGTSLP